MERITARPSRKARTQEKPGKLSIDQRLLEAMERLLEDNKNFATLSIEQLTKEAGISRGTFYLHFKDKNELVVRLIEHLTGIIVDSIGNWGLEVEWANAADVEVAVDGMMRTLYKHRAIMVAIRDMMVSDANIRELYENMINHVSLRAQKSVASVMRRGEARDGMNTNVGNVLTWIVALYTNDIIDRVDEAGLEDAIRSMKYICVTTIFTGVK